MERNKVYNIDAIDGLRKLEDNVVDLVITSPPYADMKKYADGSNGIPVKQYVAWLLPFIEEISRVLKPTGSFILNINDKVSNKFRDPYVYELVYKITSSTGLKLYERLFWNKGKGLSHPKRFGDKIEYIFWFAKTDKFTINIDEMRVPYSKSSLKRFNKPIKKRFNRTEGDEKIEYKEWGPNPKGALPSTLINIGSESKRISDNHIAVYPEALSDYFIKGSTNEGDLVIDPFMGSGTTGVSAKKHKRHWIGFDNIEEYVNFANQRIKNTKINDKVS
jgi:site-specific DNA-methyltransferase (adenine-specific)|tara:strand:+ start:14599 stop:15426 length:828 start_codon:yes stop_codon:yes gene_type:complete